MIATNDKPVSHNVRTGFFVISLSSNIYSITAIKRAAFDINDKFNISIGTRDAENFEITITQRSTRLEVNQEIFNQFEQLVRDHQLRIELEEQYNVIRNIIIAQAFQPCENLKEILDILDQ